MRRREFITLLGCAAATWPLAARAQQASRLGVLLYSNPSADQQTREVLRGLADLGAISRDVTSASRTAMQKGISDAYPS